MYNNSSELDLTIEGMKRGIDKAGGLFYQYRPCRRNDATIYDIENIRHDVVYAQTPLNMNDPFDSQIGFSPEGFVDECVSEVINALDIDEPLKHILNSFIKARITGKTVKLIKHLNDLKAFIWKRQRTMHMTNLKMTDFVRGNLKLLVDKCPADIKSQFPPNTFVAFCMIVCGMNKTKITEEDIEQAFKLETTIDELYKQAEEVRDSVYLKAMREFLEKITVSCFSSSGWNNQLMWSHYANSYAGICIEYDFSKVEDNIGFFYPVEYNDRRPTVMLEDVGLRIKNQNGRITAVNDCETDIKKIFSYLLVKNTCWEYEKEWRIINVGEANTPRFVPLPLIKSITFGLSVDGICKSIIWEICKEKGIECYQLEINSDNYELNRKLLEEADFVFDVDQEAEYIATLIKQVNILGERLSSLTEGFAEDKSEKSFMNLDIMLMDTIDALANVYFIKQSLNRVAFNSEDDLHGGKSPEEIMNYVREMEKMIKATDESMRIILDNLPKLILAGKVPVRKKNGITKQLNNALELIAKYRDVLWHDAFVEEGSL